MMTEPEIQWDTYGTRCGLAKGRVNGVECWMMFSRCPDDLGNPFWLEVDRAFFGSPRYQDYQRQADEVREGAIALLLEEESS